MAVTMPTGPSDVAVETLETWLSTLTPAAVSAGPPPEPLPASPPIPVVDGQDPSLMTSSGELLDERHVAPPPILEPPVAVDQAQDAPATNAQNATSAPRVRVTGRSSAETQAWRAKTLTLRANGMPYGERV